MSQGEKMELPKLVWMHGNELGPEWTYDQYSVSVAGNGLSKAEALEVIAIVEDRYPRVLEALIEQACLTAYYNGKGEVKPDTLDFYTKKPIYQHYLTDAGQAVLKECGVTL